MWMFTPINASARGIKVKIKASENVSAPVVGEVNLYGESYALVIGINNYTHGWPRLSGAVNDAKLVAAELLKKGFNVTLKTNLDSKTLEQTFKEFFILKGDDPKTRLFIWFAGHGHTLNGEGFLIPSDAPLPHKGAEFRLKALSMRRFGEYVRLAQSKHALAVFDSCFSGTIFDTQRSAPPPAITRATTFPVRQFLTSGDTDQKVSDDGRFRKLFIRAIRGEERADANQDGYVTGSELGLFLTDRVTNLTRSRQTPRYGKLRDEDYDRGDFVFLLASSGAVIEKPSPKASKAYLTVESNVPGAKVLVDGRYIGTTNLSGIKITPGDHRVRVEKDGYEPYSKRVLLKAGRSMSLTVFLDPKTPAKSNLYVDTNPKDAQVRILNIGPVFYQGMALDAGRYHVEVSRDGYETKKVWLPLTAGKDNTLNIHLKPIVTYQPGSQGRKVSNSLGMDFVYIKPGTFMMGSPLDEPGRHKGEKQHRVTLTKGFYVQTTEVTQGQWKAVMRNNPSLFKNCGDDCPVEQVSWNDVQQFIRNLNQREGSGKYRLPTEAEWEYACRAGTDTPFSFGRCLSTDQANYNGNYPLSGCSKGKYRKRTIPVAFFSPNAWGLYDMHGNVYEWCQDWSGDYSPGSVTDPTGPSDESNRVVRGGSWGRGAGGCRSANRERFSPFYGGAVLGFRLVKTIDPAVKKVSSDVSAKEIKRDGRFVAYANGTVKDTKTGLMWAAKDNGENINWKNAKQYCESYRGGGYTDWRMPTMGELKGLYEENITGYKQDCESNYVEVKLTNLIHITCSSLWSLYTKTSHAMIFVFHAGAESWAEKSWSNERRALPVRVYDSNSKP